MSKLRALVIGGGGREHAIAWKLAQSPLVERIYAAPGNPGIAAVSAATCVKPADATPAGYLAVAQEVGADLTVVGPEAPLVAGTVDLFRANGKRVIGPTAAAAQLEGSKAFSKAFMVRAGIPTARAVTADDASSAARHLDEIGYPVVLKADGLAAGKGVIIAPDRAAALDALAKLPPGKIVVEEFLTGEEVSFIVLADGDKVWPLEATQDHKAIFDGDQGPNTGGMGAYCDGRILAPKQVDEILRLVILPSLTRMIEEGTPYTGFLYAGLMMTASGPKVLEFNARLGDPEAQTIMHRMESDFAVTLLDGAPIAWKNDASVCVVMAAHGYPGDVRTGDEIRGIEMAESMTDATVFHAGTRRGPGGRLETAGGRVLGVTASGATLPAAIERAYAAVGHIAFDGAQYRRDIGAKGLRRWGRG